MVRIVTDRFLDEVRENKQNLVLQTEHLHSWNARLVEDNKRLLDIIIDMKRVGFNAQERVEQPEEEEILSDAVFSTINELLEPGTVDHCHLVRWAVNAVRGHVPEEEIIRKIVEGETIEI